MSALAVPTVPISYKPRPSRQGLAGFVDTCTVERHAAAMLASLLSSSSSDNTPDGRTASLPGKAREDTGAHVLCTRHDFAPNGAAAARELVRLVGMDPETTTAAEMDRFWNGRLSDEKKRVLCALCPLRMYLSTGDALLMVPWDAAHTDRVPVWMLLTDAGAAVVRRRELPEPLARHLAWVCALCPHHRGLRQKVELLKLVQDRHNVAAPGERDWTRMERILRTTPIPVVDERNGS
ncbi:hypothetical protein C8R44DRAFT_875494 [Mycena epipterygia]|nr:hypothetical protein C8R44DRAFT_875494 [Mycena epipterygia]